MNTDTQQGGALLPCPFCGSADLDLSNGYDEDANWVVVCRSCKSSGTFCVEKHKAVSRWNARSHAISAAPAISAPAPPAQPEGEQERLKRARQIIDAVVDSPCIVEVRFFSQPEEQEKLESQIAAMLAAAPSSAIAAPKCMCGHSRAAHQTFSDHDECMECVAVEGADNDGLCCEFRPVAEPVTTAAPARSALDEIEVALISVADGAQPSDAVQRAFDVINRERLRVIAEPVATIVSPPDADTLVKQWIATLSDESRVTDEDAEDLTFRIIAFASRPVTTTAARAAAEKIWERINVALAGSIPAEIKAAFGDDAGVQVGEGAIPKIAAIIEHYCFPAAGVEAGGDEKQAETVQPLTWDERRALAARDRRKDRK